MPSIRNLAVLAAAVQAVYATEGYGVTLDVEFTHESGDKAPAPYAYGSSSSEAAPESKKAAPTLFAYGGSSSSSSVHAKPTYTKSHSFGLPSYKDESSSYEKPTFAAPTHIKGIPTYHEKPTHTAYTVVSSTSVPFGAVLASGSSTFTSLPSAFGGPSPVFYKTKETPYPHAEKLTKGAEKGHYESESYSTSCTEEETYTKSWEKPTYTKTWETTAHETYPATKSWYPETSESWSKPSKPSKPVETYPAEYPSKSESWSKEKDTYPATESWTKSESWEHSYPTESATKPWYPSETPSKSEYSSSSWSSSWAEYPTTSSWAEYPTTSSWVESSSSWAEYPTTSSWVEYPTKSESWAHEYPSETPKSETWEHSKPAETPYSPVSKSWEVPSYSSVYVTPIPSTWEETPKIKTIYKTVTATASCEVCTTSEYPVPTWSKTWSESWSTETPSSSSWSPEYPSSSWTPEAPSSSWSKEYPSSSWSPEKPTWTPEVPSYSSSSEKPAWTKPAGGYPTKSESWYTPAPTGEAPQSTYYVQPVPSTEVPHYGGGAYPSAKPSGWYGNGTGYGGPETYTGAASMNSFSALAMAIAGMAVFIIV